MEENKIPETEVVEETEVKEDVKNEEEAPTEEKLSKSEKKALKKLEGELEAIKGELAEANDKYLRLYAEYENYRKRSAKEKESVYADAYCDALLQILPILDNLERAAEYKNAEGEDSPLAKGLGLTLKSFSSAMEKMGVHEIEAENKPFDPEKHNAVMHVDDENLPENTVVEVFMKGYARGDKLLRPSMVKVAN